MLLGPAGMQDLIRRNGKLYTYEREGASKPINSGTSCRIASEFAARCSMETRLVTWNRRCRRL